MPPAVITYLAILTPLVEEIVEPICKSVRLSDPSLAEVLVYEQEN